MASYFAYQEQLVNQEVRLLRIHPGEDDQVVECDIITSDLASDVEYNALSYVWGDSAARKEVVLNKKRVEITESLCGALTRYRSSAQTRLLWADAICINQNDMPEKTR